MHRFKSLFYKSEKVLNLSGNSFDALTSHFHINPITLFSLTWNPFKNNIK